MIRCTMAGGSISHDNCGRRRLRSVRQRREPRQAHDGAGLPGPLRTATVLLRRLSGRARKCSRAPTFRLRSGSISFPSATPTTWAACCSIPACRWKMRSVNANIVTMAFGQTLGVLGRTAQVLVVVPYVEANLDGLFAGAQTHLYRSGLGDMVFRYAMNIHGAPAMNRQEYAEIPPKDHCRRQHHGVRADRPVRPGPSDQHRREPLGIQARDWRFPGFREMDRGGRRRSLAVHRKPSIQRQLGAHTDPARQPADPRGALPAPSNLAGSRWDLLYRSAEPSQWAGQATTTRGTKDGAAPSGLRSTAARRSRSLSSMACSRGSAATSARLGFRTTSSGKRALMARQPGSGRHAASLSVCSLIATLVLLSPAWAQEPSSASRGCGSLS